MNENHISDAMGGIDDSYLEETDRLRNRIIPIGKARGASSRRVVGRLLTAAILVGLLAVTGFGVYERWHMPERGEPYQGEIVQTERAATYPVSTEDTDPPEEKPEAYTDEWFISQARAVLNLVNKQNPDVTNITVTHQKNQLWNRQEVQVSFASSEGSPFDVLFDALDGNLIGVTAFDHPASDGTPMSEEEAAALAQRFYDALPYAKGYQFSHLEKMDDEDWMFSFSKPIQVELLGETMTITSEYEQVRIILNPCTGQFLTSNCFYVPLLDDHGSSDEPITQEQAAEIVANSGLFHGSVEDYTLTARIAVCLPNPGQMANLNGTSEDFSTDYQMYSMTRLGWALRFDRTEPGEFADSSLFCVDLYTGEILSKHETK